MLSFIIKNKTRSNFFSVNYRYPQLTEIYTRSSTNFWIVGKRSDGRVLYIVVPKKEASLAEVEGNIICQ